MNDTATLPRSLAALRSILDTLRPPEKTIEPGGSWKQRYAVWIMLPNERGYIPKSAGTLALERARRAGGASLSVNQATEQNDRTLYCVDAEIEADDDVLATPQRWTWSSVIRRADGRIDELTHASGHGEVAGGKLALTQHGATTTAAAPAHWTSNWSLFDAVQRLPYETAQAPEFMMLEELQLSKPRQRLVYRAAVDVPLAAGAARLHCFEQIGHGILPYHYWLDEHHRLLMAIGGLRAFVFDPQARLPEEQA